MKRVLIALIIFLALSSAGLAAKETTIFNGWIEYNGVIEHGTDTYRIISSDVHLEDEEKGQILIRKDSERFLIAFGDCLEEPTFEFCFENRSFERSEVDIDDRGQLQPALKLKLIKRELQITLDVKKTISQTKFLIGDTADITLTLENKGDIDITDIKIIEEVPANFEIIKSEHPFVGNRLERNLNLFEGSSWQTSYTIKANSKQEVTYATNISYFALNQSYEKLYHEKKLTFDESHVFTEPKVVTKVKRQDKEQITFSIKNTDNVDVIVESFTIEVSPQSRIEARKNMQTQTSQKVVARPVTINVGETQEISAEIIFPTVGNMTVEYFAEISARNEIFTYNGTFDIEVDLETISCLIDIPDEVNASSIVKTNIIIENGEDESFYEVEGSYELLNEQGTYEIKNINRESSIIGKRIDLVIPFQLEETTYNLTHKAKYRTVDNQYFTCETIKEIKVNPAQQLIAMNTYFKDEEALRNTTTILVVELENLLNDPITQPINLYFSSVQANASQKRLNGLTTTQTIEVEVSTYEFLRSNNATVTTNLQIPDLDNYADSTTAQITISNPYEGNLTVWEIQEQEQDEIQQEIIEKEQARQEMSLIDKIIDYLKNFFK